ncbi:MAG TPA: thioredoxin [Gammaproteobacteria bacterium]|nr:thioredoxin [Gammaproteobacteria bacterium]
MMKRLIGILLFWCLQPLAAHATAGEGLQPGLVNPGYHEQPAWFKQSFLDLRDDVAEARAAGKRVLLYFYQDGCPYCKKLLETNFGLRDISDKARRYFDVIAINIWGDREVTDLAGKVTTEKQFAADNRVMFTPTLLFLDEQGKVVMRLNGYYPPHRFSAVLDYVGQHMEETAFRDYWAGLSPPAASGRLHRDPSYLQPPYRLAHRNSGKPLLVLFEQKDCAACDELHGDILRRPQSRELLRGFDVVLLDMWSQTPVQTPDGEQLTAADWARRLKVQYAPTMVMFDTSGKEVFRTEAYLKAFHTQSALDYVLSGAYREQPNFQRYIQARADALRDRGVVVDIMD